MQLHFCVVPSRQLPASCDVPASLLSFNKNSPTRHSSAGFLPTDSKHLLLRMLVVAFIVISAVIAVEFACYLGLLFPGHTRFGCEFGLWVPFAIERARFLPWISPCSV